ncbi:MAG: response regulator [Desulfobacteraceae bacterium]|jgi:DNA-binding response OmpR family regulator|nr:response regulator [Desulfobacteraceae bacterium]
MSTILVIDDEKGILQLMHEALTTYGHKVETADDGLEGIRKFDDGCFDIVITDVRMPVIDGNGVAAHIRKSEKQCIPVIGISGTPWLLEADNFDMVLSKPFPLKQLLNCIRSLLSVSPRMAMGAQTG